MVEFRWKTEGTHTAGDYVHVPATVYLLVIIGLAVVVTVLITGKLSEQEKTFQVRELELEARMNGKGTVVFIKKNIADGAILKAADLEVREIERGKIPIDALSNERQAIGSKIKYA